MDRRPVLIVEDCSTDALIAKHALRKEFSIEHVRTAQEARERLETNDYRALIVDYHLPGGSGLDLLHWIADRAIDVPAVMISGQGDERIAAEALKLGAYDYIVKSEENLASLSLNLKQALHRHELEQRAQMLQQIVHNASDAIITMDLSGRILTANPAVKALFGHEPDGLIGKDLASLFPGTPARAELDQMLRAGRNGSPWSGELHARHKDGRKLLVQMSLSLLRDRRGKTVCLIGIARDTTERRQLLDRLKRLSITDNLTGLFNHRYFHDRLHYEFLRARRYGQSLACIMIDADYFKNVNDTYGHLVGDEVLKGIADLIRRATRAVDVAARYGGEEFAVLLPNTDLAGAARCAHHIWETIGGADIETRQGKLKITVSLGVSALEPDLEDEEELHRRADTALLAAKRRGRNNVCLWTETGSHASAQLEDLFGRDPAVHSPSGRSHPPARQRFLDTLRPLLDALCRRLPRLGSHSARVAQLAMALARHAGLDNEAEEPLRYAALFHDIGHIVTPLALLHKPGPLTPAEGRLVRKHVEVGESLLSGLVPSRAELLIVRHHHERYDGTGYPDGLKGEAIPLGARILALADAYDAMTSERPYRRALSREEAAAELERNAGAQFDPELVPVFLKLVEASTAEATT